MDVPYFLIDNKYFLTSFVLLSAISKICRCFCPKEYSHEKTQRITLVSLDSLSLWFQLCSKHHQISFFFRSKCLHWNLKLLCCCWIEIWYLRTTTSNWPQGNVEENSIKLRSNISSWFFNSFCNSKWISISLKIQIQYTLQIVIFNQPWR